MKFELGQKVKYKRRVMKKKLTEFLMIKNFSENEEKEIKRREFIELSKERFGYIMGRRNLVFKTIFSVNYGSENCDSDGNYESDFIDIVRQEKRFAYVVAYDMGHTDYVLEEDLKEINKEEIMEKVYRWWDHLTEDEQLKIMLGHFPEQVKEDTDIDKMFGDMPDDIQLWIYNKGNK